MINVNSGICICSLAVYNDGAIITVREQLAPRAAEPTESSRKMNPSTNETTETKACKINFKGVWYPKIWDVHEKFVSLETQNLRPLRTCQKHFEAILANFPPNECKI